MLTMPSQYYMLNRARAGRPRMEPEQWTRTIYSETNTWSPSFQLMDHNGIRDRTYCRDALFRPRPKPRPNGVLSALLLWSQHWDEPTWLWGFEFACESLQLWSVPLPWCKGLSPFCETALVICIIPISSSVCDVCSSRSMSSLYPFNKKSEQFLRIPWSYGFLNLPPGPLR